MNQTVSSSRLPKRRINGVLLLDKAMGVSSNTALQQVRRLFAADKAGHTGVLDPLATGLLPVCFGEATKFAQYLLDADKAYEAVLQFGQATSTGDAEGEVVAEGRADVDLAAFQAACAALTGPIRQVPPMFSALKHQGKPLYEYARQGITLARKARDITVYAIDIRHFSPPLAAVVVRCSKGTYIRTLAEDLARQMGTVAHLRALRRTRTAGFDIADSHALTDLAAMSEAERDALLLPCDVLVQHLPAWTLTAEQWAQLRFGQQPLAQDAPADTPLRAYAPDGTFAGLVVYQPASSRLKVLRLMSGDAA